MKGTLLNSRFRFRRRPTGVSAWINVVDTFERLTIFLWAEAYWCVCSCWWVNPGGVKGKAPPAPLSLSGSVFPAGLLTYGRPSQRKWSEFTQSPPTRNSSAFGPDQSQKLQRKRGKWDVFDLCRREQGSCFRSVTEKNV